MAKTDPKDQQPSAEQIKADKLSEIANEVAQIAKTPPHERSMAQNERLQDLEKQRQELLGAAAHPAPPADAKPPKK